MSSIKQLVNKSKQTLNKTQTNQDEGVQATTQKEQPQQKHRQDGKGQVNQKREDDWKEEDTEIVEQESRLKNLSEIKKQTNLNKPQEVASWKEEQIPVPTILLQEEPAKPQKKMLNLPGKGKPAQKQPVINDDDFYPALGQEMTKQPKKTEKKVESNPTTQQQTTASTSTNKFQAISGVPKFAKKQEGNNFKPIETIEEREIKNKSAAELVQESNKFQFGQGPIKLQANKKAGSKQELSEVERMRIEKELELEQKVKAEREKIAAGSIIKKQHDKNSNNTNNDNNNNNVKEDVEVQEGDEKNIPKFAPKKKPAGQQISLNQFQKEEQIKVNKQKEADDQKRQFDQERSDKGKYQGGAGKKSHGEKQDQQQEEAEEEPVQEVKYTHIHTKVSTVGWGDE